MSTRTGAISALTLAVILGGGKLVPGQQRGYARRGPVPVAVDRTRTTSLRVPQARGEADASTVDYRRYSESRPEPTPVPARRNYYPGLRSGQGPNANVGGRAHCVPGRGAMAAVRR